MSLQCVFLLLPFLSFPFFAGCSGKENVRPEDPDDLLFALNDSSLRLSWVTDRIPPGLSPDDSIALFNSIVEEWTLDMLLSSIPDDQIPDEDEIERKVASYRRRLRLISWKREMNEKALLSVSQDSLLGYLKAHPEEFTLEKPVVRGMFVSVQTGSRISGNLKNWVADGSDASVDNIEKALLSAPFRFDWFGDDWVGIDEVASRFPGVRLPAPEDIFRDGGFFEWTASGTDYFLKILEVIPAGAPMPESVALEAAAERMRATDIAEFQKGFIRRQLEFFKKKGTLRVGSLDPLAER